MNPSVTSPEPASIRAGDSAAWRLVLPQYPASAGWSVTYTLVRMGGKLSITAAPDGDDHVIDLAPATTAAWPAGRYAWQARASNGAAAHTLATGALDVLADFAALAPGGMDTRSHAERTLAALEAWIEGRDLGVAEYEIAGRRMKTIPIADLLLLRDRYRRELRTSAGRRGRILLRT